MTGHTAHTGHMRALDTEHESHVTHSDLDHGVRVQILMKDRHLGSINKQIHAGLASITKNFSHTPNPTQHHNPYHIKSV